MSQNPAFDKLIRLLKELFQLDQPDLDFGLYRIMHARTREISQFLDRDLLPQVQAAFSQHRTADKAELKKDLSDLIAGIKKADMDPEASPKVKELRLKIADHGVDATGLAHEVYDHLYKFFRRYYHEGDFLSKRVYKPGVYAIPYEGEEVKLHWANKDQYYIKTSEYLRDYTFVLKPGAKDDPMRVHFRLKDVAEGEHGNIKASEDQNRVFILAKKDFITEEVGESGRELVIYFEYRSATLADWPEAAKEQATEAAQKKPPVQKVLRDYAVRCILAIDDDTFKKHWLTELTQTHIKANGEPADYCRLAGHLNRYTCKNTFDYFIHKDLGSFLRRELDFYIKNEVMHLDNIESETVPRVEQYLSKIKVIRQIAGKIIDFLAQLENFQKKLWLKKKFVTETCWCIRVGCIPEEFYSEIAANGKQREEWISLHAIDEIQGEMFTVGYSEPLTPEFIKAHPTLIVDTRHFDEGFTQRLLEAMGDIDGQTDGIVFHGENFQALSVIKKRYEAQVDCICIDPPYNTGSDGFCYKDNYKDSSWLSQQQQTFSLSYTLLTKIGSVFTCSDENEAHNYSLLLREIFGSSNLVETLIWNKRVPKNDKGIGNIHDYIFLLSKNLKERRALNKSYQMRKDEINIIYDLVNRCKSQSKSLEKTQIELKKFYRKQGYDRGLTLYCEIDPNYNIWGKINMSWPNPKTQGPRYEVINPITQKGVPIPKNGWRWKEETYRQAENQGPTYILPDGSMMKGRIWYSSNESVQPSSITYLEEVETFLLRSILSVKSDGGVTLENMGIGGWIDYPKPTLLMERLLFSLEDKNENTIDYFAGSGTTGHAVINLNRDDAGQRKFILIEVGNYFDTVLLPRLKKVTFTPEWKAGKPKRLATDEEAKRSPRMMKVVRLESYEDALNNLELRRNELQDSLLKFAEAQGPGGLREQYLLRYMLDVETRGSQSLLNIGAFTDPTAYRLKVKRPGSEETREINVDLLETFNWLIGLTVDSIAAPQTFTANFKHDNDPDLPKDSPSRLLLVEGVRENTDGPWWFRRVTGTTPDGRKTLVVWRKLTDNQEQDNLVLNEWFKKQGYSSNDSEFDLIYINGDNNLENLRQPDDTWKVRLVEEDFHRLMFVETEA